MPPTRAAATMTASGRFSQSHSWVSACRVRSSARRSAVNTSQRSDASRRTSAAPTMPRWPATKTRLPARSNGSAFAAGSRVMSQSALIMPIDAFAFQSHLLAVAVDHLVDEIRKARLVAPAKLLVRLAGVAEQHLDLGRAEIARIDFNENLSGLGINPGFIDAFTTPRDLAAHMAESAFDEFTHRMFLASGQHIVVRLVLLEHHPHALHIV